MECRDEALDTFKQLSNSLRLLKAIATDACDCFNVRNQRSGQLRSARQFLAETMVPGQVGQTVEAKLGEQQCGIRWREHTLQACESQTQLSHETIQGAGLISHGRDLSLYY